MDALRTFRVEGELVARTTGPAVTQFEVAPAAGVKVVDIVGAVEVLRGEGRAPAGASLDEMEALWAEAKKNERPSTASSVR